MEDGFDRRPVDMADRCPEVTLRLVSDEFQLTGLFLWRNVAVYGRLPCILHFSTNFHCDGG